MYNTNINIIASIPNINIIHDIIINYSKGLKKNDLFDQVVNKNAYGIRTLKSRKRFFAAIESTFLSFKTDQHREVITTFFSDRSFYTTQRKIIFLQFAINDELFYKLTTQVFLKFYYAGRLNIKSSDCSGFLFELREKHSAVVKWADSTLSIIAIKYLTLLKKLDFLEGRNTKRICNITMSDESIIAVTYILKSIGEEYPNFLLNQYIPLFLLSKEELIVRLKKIAQKGYFDIAILGHDMKIDLKYNHKDILSEIRKNY